VSVVLGSRQEIVYQSSAGLGPQSPFARAKVAHLSLKRTNRYFRSSERRLWPKKSVEFGPADVVGSRWVGADLSRDRRRLGARHVSRAPGKRGPAGPAGLPTDRTLPKKAWPARRACRGAPPSLAARVSPVRRTGPVASMRGSLKIRWIGKSPVCGPCEPGVEGQAGPWRRVSAGRGAEKRGGRLHGHPERCMRPEKWPSP
jgi:hypothetical protein